MKEFLINAFSNKRFYLSTTIAMFVWLTFLDDSNLMVQFKLWRKCIDLEEKKELYEKEYQKVLQDRKHLLSNSTALETFGREKYFMKKEGETVFVLVDEDQELFEEKEF